MWTDHPGCTKVSPPRSRSKKPFAVRPVHRKLCSAFLVIIFLSETLDTNKKSLRVEISTGQPKIYLRWPNIVFKCLCLIHHDLLLNYLSFWCLCFASVKVNHSRIYGFLAFWVGVCSCHGLGSVKNKAYKKWFLFI